MSTDVSTITLNVKILGGNDQTPISVPTDLEAEALLTLAADVSGVGDFRLIHRGKVVTGDGSIERYGMKDGDLIVVVPKSGVAPRPASDPPVPVPDRPRVLSKLEVQRDLADLPSLLSDVSVAIANANVSLCRADPHTFNQNVEAAQVSAQRVHDKMRHFNIKEMGQAALRGDRTWEPAITDADRAEMERIKPTLEQYVKDNVLAKEYVMSDLHTSLSDE